MKNAGVKLMTPVNILRLTNLPPVKYQSSLISLISVFNWTLFPNWARYSRMDQINFVEDSLKKFEMIWSPEAEQITSNFLKTAFRKFYLLHPWILYQNLAQID